MQHEREQLRQSLQLVVRPCTRSSTSSITKAADLLGNLLACNAPTSENAAETPSEGVETEDEIMSPLCLQQEQSEAQKKQASRLKKAS